MKTILNKYLLLSFSLILLISVSACHKEGVGGNSSVSGTVRHHSPPVPNCVVYIKYGATEFPGTDVSVYNNHVTADGSGNYSFTGLYPGDYFLYGVGYDNSIMQPVTGGVGVKLKKNAATTSDVPVTE